MKFEVFGKRIEIKYKYPIPQNLSGAEKVEWVVANQPKKRLVITVKDVLSQQDRDYLNMNPYR